MFDPAFNIWLQQLSSPALDRVMAFFTSLGTDYFYMALLPLVYWCVDRRRGHELAYLFLVSMWLNGLLKDVFNMPRPSAAEGVRQLAREYSNGFPSGHAQGSMTLYGYLFAAYRVRWLRWLCVFLIAMITLSRPYLGMHYLGDILGGLAIGLVLVLVFRWAYARGVGDGWSRRGKAVLAVLVPLLLVPLYADSVAYQTLGFLMGLLASGMVAPDAVPFEPRVRWTAQGAKLLVGYLGFAALYALHATLIPNGLLEVFGYAVIAVWVTTGAPLVFRRLGLAADPPGPPAARPDLARRIAAWTGVAVLVVAAGTALAGPARDPGTVPVLSRPAAGRPWVIAHQGGERLRPSNTLEAFRHGLAVGGDWLELDVHLTADGQVVVIHDDTVDRTTGARGEVHAMTLAELKALDAGYYWSPDEGKSYPFRGRGLTIPTLDEVFEAFPQARYVVELKDDDPALADAVVGLLRKHGLEDRVIVASFHDGVLGYFRSIAPGVATSLAQGEALRFYIMYRLGLAAFTSPPGVAVQVPEYHFGGRLKVLSRAFVRAAHGRGLEVHAWTINDERTMRRLLSYGVDGIVTDVPDLARRVVDGFGPD